ncbi:hypothetical protein JCM5296_006736 [Sporobolomyces johnsonii]
MSTPVIPTRSVLIDSPVRPSSAGPFASSSSSSSAPSSPSSASVSPNTAHLSRPSALSIRPQLGNVQTRIRARSINSGKGASVSAVLPQLAPTLAGSPVLPGVDSFLRGQHAAGDKDGRYAYEAYEPSPLARTRGDERSPRRRGDTQEPDECSEVERTSSGTEESASTRSDSPPPTPRDFDDVTHEIILGAGLPSFRLAAPSRRGSTAEWEERENWRTGGELDEETHPLAKEVNTRNRSKSLEGITRMSVRRGRSFTSLLCQPEPGTSPTFARKELFQPPGPILETYETEAPSPPATEHADIKSGEEHFPSTAVSLYPPTLAEAAPPVIAALPLERKTLRDFVPQLIILVTLFLSSFAVIFFFISTLPGLFLPHSVADLPALTKTLSAYRASSFGAELHLFGVLTLLFLWKQCFSIPGSVLTNILFGALYGTTMGTWWACLWTAAGSTGAYAIALVIAPLVEYYFATPLDMTRRALKLPHPSASPAATTVPLSGSDLFSHLLLARFFPLLPYSVLNVISGVLRLPLLPFFTTLLLGSFPFNFATVSIGNLVALAASDPSTPLGDKIWSRQVVLKLVAVTLVSVVPLAFKEQLRRLLSSGGALSRALERVKSAISRRLFGFGAVPSSVQAPAFPSGRAPGGGPRGWRRKLGRSIGGAGELLAQGFAPLGIGRRNPYERVPSDAGLPMQHFADGPEDAEMGGVHVGGGGIY